MAVKTYIDAELGIAVQKLSGALAAADVVEAQKRLYIEMGVHPKIPCLWDAVDGDVAAAMDSSGMRTAVGGGEEIWERMKGGRTAILVNDDADFGMGRMYAAMAESMPREIRVFYSKDEAVAWLTSSDKD